MRGSVALVTGGTRGLGAAITERVARTGVHVAAVYRSAEATARTFAEQLSNDGLSVSVHRADLAEPSACRAVVDEVASSYGPIDYLVNNAGVLIESKVVDITDGEWSQVLAANLGSAFFLAQAVWQGMVERRFGRIVNVGSVTATSGNPVEVAYGSAKAGMIGMTRSLAMAGARKGITVNCVVPGVFATDMMRAMEERDRERIARMIPVGRVGETHEFAHMVVSLLADEASYVTGAVLMVDGGLGMGA
jgi:NAD(P)-dependent dehydrogenase (short-subunit alcohol dehydrogenase family)